LTDGYVASSARQTAYRQDSAWHQAEIKQIFLIDTGDFYAQNDHDGTGRLYLEENTGTFGAPQV
jgi:hypothetical protein